MRIKHKVYPNKLFVMKLKYFVTQVNIFHFRLEVHCSLFIKEIMVKK